jgi:formylglycine-generating enzyme required for sulfatase activity
MSVNKNPGKKKKNKAVQEVPIESIQVKLKPVFGIQPRTYIPAVWTVILLSAVFFLLMLPGIRKNGTYLKVESLPPGASVIVDGIRLGSSGDNVFVSRGSRNLLVRKQGFIPEEQKIEISGRIFASRIFPLRKTMKVILEPEKDYDFAGEGIREFASWSATGPEESRYAIPPALSRSAENLLQTGMNDKSSTNNSIPLTLQIPMAALPLSLDERQLADITRAQFLLSSRGAALNIQTLINFIDDTLEETPVPEDTSDPKDAPLSGEKKVNLPDMLLPALYLLDEKRLEALNLNDIKEEMKKSVSDLASEAETLYSSALNEYSFPAHLLADRKFISIPEITLPIGDMEAVMSGYNPRSGALPVMAHLEAFSISAYEVNNRDYALFISDNPEWSVENRETLISEGKADENYLAGWGISGYSSGDAQKPVTGVSWYAAEAYSRWFTQHQLRGSGLTARLPREDEWEIAGRLNRSAENTSELPREIQNTGDADGGTLGILGMGGNVREWALNPYRVNENLFRPADGTPAYQSPSDPLAAPGRTVRGGAFIDSGLPYPVAVRGGLNPEICSPVIGFRLVIAASDRPGETN